MRAVNKNLPLDRRIRIGLGEPPIDRSSATDAEFRSALNQRDSYPAKLIVENILIYGTFHLTPGETLYGLVEAKHPGAFFLALSYAEYHRPPACAPLLDRAAKLRPPPAIAVVAPRDAADPLLQACTTYSYDVPFVETPTRGSQLFDAIIFYGPLESLTRISFLPDYFLDEDYRREMHRRSDERGLRRFVRFSKDFAYRKADYAIDLEAPGYFELGDAMFSKYDRNRDGVVTSDEYVDRYRLEQREVHV